MPTRTSQTWKKTKHSKNTCTTKLDFGCCTSKVILSQKSSRKALLHGLPATSHGVPGNQKVKVTVTTVCVTTSNWTENSEFAWSCRLCFSRFSFSPAFSDRHSRRTSRFSDSHHSHCFHRFLGQNPDSVAVQIMNSWLKVRCLEVLVLVETKCALPWLAEHSRTVARATQGDRGYPGGFQNGGQEKQEHCFRIRRIGRIGTLHFSKHPVQPRCLYASEPTDFCLPRHCWTVLKLWHWPVIYPKRAGTGAVQKLHKTTVRSCPCGLFCTN